ncbi:MAG: alpha/beta fold hydrolase BchO [Hyphomicrobium sp.]
MSRTLNWPDDRQTWPNSAFSRFVEASGLRWHVQVMGSGPVMVMIHGTGASTHSWRRLLPMLAEHFTVVAPDLPGHGFTSKPSSAQLTLPGMAAAVAGLLAEMTYQPAFAVGHSAGAAVLIRATLNSQIHPKLIVSLNGALLPFEGLAGQLFKPLAKALVLQPFVPHLAAWRAGSSVAVERLLAGTGSSLSPEDVALYGRLFQSPDHVAATLAMMANWDLVPLAADMARLKVPLLLIAGARDLAIKPSDAVRAGAIAPMAHVETISDVGHLAHEEKPKVVCDLVLNHIAALTAQPAEMRRSNPS